MKLELKANSVAFRLIAGATLLIGGALILSGLFLAAIFGDHIRASLDRRINVLLDSLIAVSEIDDTGALILKRAPGEPLFDQPYSGWYWQIAKGDAIVLRSRSLWDTTLTPPPAAGRGGMRRYDAVGPQDQKLRVLARDITLPDSDQAFRYAVAADLAVLEAERRPFDTTLGWSLGILWLGLMAAALIQVRFGLQPLRRMRAALADVRAGRADRLRGDFPAEITPLADELNAHLGQIDEVVERARTHVGNLAHALKTPLSVLRNDAALADGPLAKSVRRQAAIMSRRVDHYLVRARTAATSGLIGARTDLAPVMDDLRRTLMRIHRDRGIEVVVEGGAPAAFRGDRQDVEEMIGNVMDNGCKWARSKVRARLAVDGASIRVIVEDDGPGLPPEKRAEALARGGRLDESVPGTGLGLAIVQEIAGLYGGSVALDDSELGGLRVDLVLPAAEVSGPA